MFRNNVFVVSLLSLFIISGLAYSQNTNSTEPQIREIAQYEKMQHENFSKYGMAQQFEGCFYDKGTSHRYKTAKIFSYTNLIDAAKNNKISCMVFSGNRAFGKTTDNMVFKLQLNKAMPHLIPELIKYKVKFKSMPPEWQATR